MWNLIVYWVSLSIYNRMWWLQILHFTCAKRYFLWPITHWVTCVVKFILLRTYFNSSWTNVGYFLYRLQLTHTMMEHHKMWHLSVEAWFANYKWSYELNQTPSISLWKTAERSRQQNMKLNNVSKWWLNKYPSHLVALLLFSQPGNKTSKHTVLLTSRFFLEAITATGWQWASTVSNTENVFRLDISTTMILPSQVPTRIWLVLTAIPLEKSIARYTEYHYNGREQDVSN